MDIYSKGDPWNQQRVTPHSKRRVRVLKSLASIFQGKRVLELGCGLGTLTGIFANGAVFVSGLDISPIAIEQARQQKPANVEFNVGSIFDFDDFAKFDVVTLIECLYYLPRDEQCAVLARIKRSGSGRLLISAPVIGANQFRKYYTEQELTGLLREHGFSIDSSHVLSLWYPPTRLERYLSLGLKALYMTPADRWLDPVWERIPPSWIYQKLFVCSY